MCLGRKEDREEKIEREKGGMEGKREHGLTVSREEGKRKKER